LRNVIVDVIEPPRTPSPFVQNPLPLPAPFAAGKLTSWAVPGVTVVRVTKAVFAPPAHVAVTVQLWYEDAGIGSPSTSTSGAQRRKAPVAVAEKLGWCAGQTAEAAPEASRIVAKARYFILQAPIVR